MHNHAAVGATRVALDQAARVHDDGAVHVLQTRRSGARVTCSLGSPYLDEVLEVGRQNQDVWRDGHAGLVNMGVAKVHARKRRREWVVAAAT